MLKSMRKNVQALKPILWIIVFTFILAIFTIWGGAGRTEKNSSSYIAQVGKEKVLADEYSQNLRQKIEILRRQYKTINASVIQQLNIPLDTLAQMLQKRLLLQLGGEMGLRVSNREVKDRIMAYPAFQQDGAFVGYDNYRRVLDYNHITIKDFEDNLRQDLLIEKTIAILTAGVTTSESEAWENFQKETETAKLEYVVVGTSQVGSIPAPSEAEMKTRFDRSPSSYRIPEKRTGDYVFLQVDDARKDVKVQQNEIEKYYKDNQAQFQEPEKTRLSRIWLPFTPETKEAVAAQAKQLVGRIQGGEDIAGLARKYSKDDKAATGGDWGYSDWRALGQADTQAVAGLEAGATAGPIESGSGYAILKVTEKKPASVQPLSDVKETIRKVIEESKARDFVNNRMQKLAKAALKEKSLEAAARKEGLTTKSTFPLKKGDPLGNLDSAGAISEAMFGLTPKGISEPVATAAGAGLVQLKEIAKERPAEFSEVKETIAAEITAQRKKDAALEIARTLRTSFKDDWKADAAARKIDYRSAETHKRGQYLGLIGENPDIDRTIFSLPLHAASEPQAVEDGWAVIRVLDRKNADKAEFDKNKINETDTLLAQKKNVFLQSYLTTARSDKKVEVNYQLFQKLNTEILARYAE